MERTAIVTGGAGGLGVAVTEAMAADGWRVVVPVEPGSAGSAEREGVSLVEADLTDPGDVARVAREAGEGVGAVVNLVGGFHAPGRVHETPVEAFEAQLRLNLRPGYLMTAAALPAMLAAGRGAVVCVSSRAALRPFSGAAGYITAKAAVLAFVDALDAEYRDDGIRVNAVLPSVIDTPGNRAAMPDADHDRWVAPSEIAQVIRFLCSEAAAATSGAHVPVYGRA
ncbi:MAG TPA: SDR family NAD(P)-dependent oxidoreductase [Baekduia sp.]|nr:SDR family NAD(P)-dependent oxidoreductase [Baekduia sp.]